MSNLEPCNWIISHKAKQVENESIVDFFGCSPHRDIDLEITRSKDLSRKVDL